MTSPDSQRYPWLVDAVGESSVVLTSSRRLANELRRANAELQVAASRQAWATPQIFFWRDWCRRTASASGGQARTVGESATLLIWERCLRKHLADQTLTTLGVAKLARATWRRLCDWRVPLEALASAAASTDQTLFAAAARDYRKELTRNDWLDSDAAIASCLELIPALDHLPKQLWLAGFDDLPPVVADLRAALDRAGSETVTVGGDGASSAAIEEVAFTERAAELRSAGAWARELLERNPDARIAIVAPDLHARAAIYRRLVTEGFAPGWQLGDDVHRHAINVSYGERLSDYPLIQVAVNVLRLVGHGLSSRDASLLLRSTFLSIGSRSDAVTIDRALRRLPDRTWSAAALADGVESWCEGDLSGGDLRHAMRALAAMAAQGDQRRPSRQWARELQLCLEAVGWPGKDTPDSASFQIINRWRELLNEVAELDDVLGPQRLSELVRVVTRLAGDVVFQPETPHGRVQLLGFLEALGHRFEHLWVAGMEAAQWPPVAQPLALVSRRLQRDRGMPDATPAESLRHARAVVRRLAAAAETVRFSWSRQVNEQHQSRSPLLAEISGEPGPSVIECRWHAAEFLAAAATTAIDRDEPPPALGEERLSGGTETLNLHTAEPFAAFAIGRLRVELLEPFEAGLPPRLRGTLLHQSLFHLLRGVAGQQAIAEWTDEDKHRRISQATDRAFAAHSQRADSVLRRLLALERRRQQSIAFEFLQREQSRPVFEIQELEKPLAYSHAGIEVVGRADRIDRMADGSLVLIDYKSGSPAAFANPAGEPNDLQLVLYAAALEAPVSGLVLAYLRRADMRYRGLGSGLPGAKGAVGELHQTLDEWLAKLQAVYREIAAGDVRLRRYAPPSTPVDLDVLSRRAETRLDA